MFDSSSYIIPTPLAHADTSRDVLPRGATVAEGRCKEVMTRIYQSRSDFESWRLVPPKKAVQRDWCPLYLSRFQILKLTGSESLESMSTRVSFSILDMV
ncbi:hypothetical protein TNCV_936791 [Trichonephila clavipes]|nr:hypothetical protein TNCV_936791 [Trichonephila clavipes]